MRGDSQLFFRQTEKLRVSFDRSEERGAFLFLSLLVHIWGHSLYCESFPLLWLVFGICMSANQDTDSAT